MRARSILLTLILVFLLGNLSGFLVLHSLEGPVAAQPGGSPATATVGPSVAAAITALTGEEERNIAIFREVFPSVVYIANIGLRRDFFSFNVLEIPQGTGSGFMWDTEGHIVTNYHVIANGSRFTVVLADQSNWDATLVGVAPDKDLAVLRIEAARRQLKPIRIGESMNLMVGQQVLAIGNPFGLDQSLTVGVLSALGRELESPGGLPIRDVIQTDAAINPGNSGGPLLDSAGRLIGVNTAIYSPSGGSAGVGFAVPVDIVRRLVPQLIEHGRPISPGIGIESVSDSLARRIGVDGVIVRRVGRGSPAERAGIEGLRRSRTGHLLIGDRIVAVNGNPIHSIEDMILAFEDIGVGATARITLVNNRRKRAVEVELIPE